MINPIIIGAALSAEGARHNLRMAQTEQAQRHQEQGPKWQENPSTTEERAAHEKWLRNHRQLLEMLAVALTPKSAADQGNTDEPDMFTAEQLYGQYGALIRDRARQNFSQAQPDQALRTELLSADFEQLNPDETNALRRTMEEVAQAVGEDPLFGFRLGWERYMQGQDTAAIARERHWPEVENEQSVNAHADAVKLKIQTEGNTFIASGQKELGRMAGSYPADQTNTVDLATGRLDTLNQEANDLIANSLNQLDRSVAEHIPSATESEPTPDKFIDRIQLNHGFDYRQTYAKALEAGQDPYQSMSEQLEKWRTPYQEMLGAQQTEEMIGNAQTFIDQAREKQLDEKLVLSGLRGVLHPYSVKQGTIEFNNHQY
jgi:hypothetical protein